MHILLLRNLVCLLLCSVLAFQGWRGFVRNAFDIGKSCLQLIDLQLSTAKLDKSNRQMLREIHKLKQNPELGRLIRASEEFNLVADPGDILVKYTDD